MKKLQPSLKIKPIYVFYTWLIVFSIIAVIYNLFWRTTADAMYMKGFFDPSIYTTIFCVITIAVLFINSSVAFLISKTQKNKDVFLITLWYLASFLTYLFGLTHFQNYYLQSYLRPSVELRESFNSYAYISIFTLSIAVIIWLVMFFRYQLQAKSPTWLTVILAILTIGLFGFYWLFIDVVSSM